jgi:uncharacterized protein (TIGR03435 family)
MRIFQHKTLGFATMWITVAVTQPQPQERLSFDVASVKSATVPSGLSLMEGGRIAAQKGSGIQIPRNTGGPGTDDPGRIHYPLITLKELLRQAWNSFHDIDGPGWLDSQAVTVDAAMPPDTTKAQFQEMLRNLIRERFGLQFHVEKKQITGYALVIAGNGPKMKMSADQGEAENARPERPTGRGKDGFPILPPVSGKMMVNFGAGDRSRIIAQQVTIQALVRNLSQQLKTTVTDATGLTAKYDFTLTYASLDPHPAPADIPEDLEPVPDLFAALQSQLGLKLDRKPVPVEVFVIDHMEKTPTKN